MLGVAVPSMLAGPCPRVQQWCAPDVIVAVPRCLTDVADPAHVLLEVAQPVPSRSAGGVDVQGQRWRGGKPPCWGGSPQR